MIWSGPGVSPASPARRRWRSARRRARRDRDAACVHRREQREVGGDSRRGAAISKPSREIGAGGADMGPASRRSASVIVSPSRLDILLDHHAVGALGHRRAGEDAHRLARADRPGWRPAGGLADHAERAPGGRRRRAPRSRPSPRRGRAAGRGARRRLGQHAAAASAAARSRPRGRGVSAKIRASASSTEHRGAS
jgi:hypothetical protein